MKNRREFIKSICPYGSIWDAASMGIGHTFVDTHGDLLPLRRLTRNGEKVTAFSLGGWHLGNVKESGSS